MKLQVHEIRTGVAASLAIGVFLLLASCSPGPQITPPPGADRAIVEVELRSDVRHQPIHNFGASDAWSVQFVGQNWPAEKRSRIADLLFSMDQRADGSPEGIGLSAWRFNIGAGSDRQGSESGIRDPWRRAESFLLDDGSFDAGAQAGQRRMLREARERGVEQFYAFVNSPPVALTRNGLAHSSGGDSANLAPERYGDFARFLSDVLQEVQRSDGVAFRYVSPVNEPQWDWEGGQEGSPWRNDEIAAFTRVLSGVLLEAGLDTRIELPETARMNYLYEVGDKPTRGDQARAFFAPSSDDFVGDLPNVARRLAAHSYFTTYPSDTLRAVRQQVRASLQAIDPSLELLVTEYCILENNPRIRGNGRDLGMASALYMAEVIHADLVDAGSTGWQWWIAVSPYNYKDGLVYIDHDTADGEVYESKMLWALGHYSRFVRPGMQRIDVAVPDSAQVNGTHAPLLVSAYADASGDRTVAVFINRGEEPAEVRVRGAGDAPMAVYRTSDADGDDLRRDGSLAPGEVLRMAPGSMVTVVGE